VRTNINYVKNTDYNIASITLGTPWYKILINNILPQIIPVLIQSISFIIPSTIALDMSLSYLGFEFVDGRTNTSIG
jgi:oligopeptide transport system permease protein